jgi:hypothetical protein
MIARQACQYIAPMHAHIVLVDCGCGLDPWSLWAVADAATIQTHRDFGRPPPSGYGAVATVRVASDPTDIYAHEWVLAYVPGPGPVTAVGYHDRTSSGQPLIRVFPALEAPAMRGVVETHEIIETLADPWLEKVVRDPFGRLVAFEPADPVEASWYPIETRHGFVPVTNFVTPAYYQPRHCPEVPYDALGMIRYPGEVLPGGYITVLTAEGGWQRMGTGALRPYRAADAGFGRSHRRARWHPAPGQPASHC